MRFWVLAAVALGAAACSTSEQTEPQGPPPSASYTLIADSVPAGTVAGVRVYPPDGIMRYSQISSGATQIFGDAALGSYRVEIDSIWIPDNSRNGANYIRSAWVATPRISSFQLDAAHPDRVERVVFRKVTGGITVSTNSGAGGTMLVEFLHPDGTGCRCTNTGNGFRGPSTGATVEGLLPGDYLVHFLAFVVSNGSPHGDPNAFVAVPDPEYVRVTVKAGENATASSAYHRQ